MPAHKNLPLHIEANQEKVYMLSLATQAACPPEGHVTELKCQ